MLYLVIWKQSILFNIILIMRSISNQSAENLILAVFAICCYFFKLSQSCHIDDMHIIAHWYNVVAITIVKFSWDGITACKKDIALTLGNSFTSEKPLSVFEPVMVSQTFGVSITVKLLERVWGKRCVEQNRNWAEKIYVYDARLFGVFLRLAARVYLVFKHLKLNVW